MAYRWRLLELYLSPLSGCQSLYAATVERWRDGGSSETRIISIEDVYKISLTLAGLATRFGELGAVEDQVRRIRTRRTCIEI